MIRKINTSCPGGCRVGHGLGTGRPIGDNPVSDYNTSNHSEGDGPGIGRLPILKSSGHDALLGRQARRSGPHALDQKSNTFRPFGKYVILLVNHACVRPPLDLCRRLPIFEAVGNVEDNENTRAERLLGAAEIEFHDYPGCAHVFGELCR